mmetsp:Transcript_30610/g.41453  ORF Transcript_30610/g.41453 Transcript_30610/m.41453 type:complete len:82 (+) Transcript_30610:599-844(+)
MLKSIVSPESTFVLTPLYISRVHMMCMEGFYLNKRAKRKDLTVAVDEFLIQILPDKNQVNGACTVPKRRRDPAEDADWGSR